MSRECDHPSCDRPHFAKGWCTGHYGRMRRGADMNKPFGKRPLIDRFLEKTRATSSGCIEWTASTNGVGYGMFFVDWDGGRNFKMLAHRWYYEYARGPIPEGLHLDHLCRNPICVNPDHLEAVTQRENTLRGIGVAAQHAAKTECVNGHPFTGENLILRSNGVWRDCRECHRAKDRRYYYQRKAS